MQQAPGERGLAAPPGGRAVHPCPHIASAAEPWSPARAGGLGREVALQLAARGCAVGIADINAAGLAETAALARDAGGAEVEEIAADLTAEGAPEAAVAGSSTAGAASTRWSTTPATA